MKQIIFLSSIFFSTLVFAQTEEEKAWTEYATPSIEHKILARYNGEWSVALKVWLKPGEDPIETVGKANSKSVFGDRYQETEFHSSLNGMPFEGKNLIGFDNALKKYISTWIDTLGTGIYIAEGTYDEKTKTMTLFGEMVDPVSRKTYKTKEITVYKSLKEFHSETFSIIDGKEVKTMEATYTKK